MRILNYTCSTNIIILGFSPAIRGLYPARLFGARIENGWPCMICTGFEVGYQLIILDLIDPIDFHALFSVNNQ